MSNLLNKRLMRSLWRTKLRLFAVIFMVSVGVFAGLTFGAYSHYLCGLYDSMDADDYDGANLADFWIVNRSCEVFLSPLEFLIFSNLSILFSVFPYFIGIFSFYLLSQYFSALLKTS